MPEIKVEHIDQLIKNCVEENPSAQRELYRLYSAKVMGICRRYTYSRFEADDIFQEAFIIIYRSLKNYDPLKGNFEHWLYRVTVNCALKHISQTKRLLFTDIEEANEVQDNYVSLDSNLKAEDLLVMIDDLPLGKKLVFNLYAIEGYSHKEIASMLEISEGTSKSQLAKAKELLVAKHKKKFDSTKKEKEVTNGKI